MSIPGAAPAKILVVDDTPQNVKLLADLLRAKGYEVATAASGPEGLERLAAERPDLVLLDVMMPLASGYEVCQRIRERADLRATKIVMLSAKGRDAEVNKGLAIGADVYVTKPFSTRDLMTRIKALLDDPPPGAPQ
jgi:DNA-binding response OmpR family regulator